MFARIFIGWWLSFGAAFSGVAADPRPAVGPGASKDDVIRAYGWPNGQTHVGAKEVLIYAQGRVTLEHGRVEKVDFSMTTPWQPPRPRPGPSPAVPATGEDERVNFWLTSFDDACREAVRRNARILALFTGLDWSPASKQFNDEVAFHPDFINAFTADFVFLQLDFPKAAPQPPELREQNAVLRTRYDVTVYPTLLVLSPAGEVVAPIDLTKPQPGETYRTRIMAAVREVRDGLVPPPPVARAPATANASSERRTPPATPSVRAFQVAEAVRSARSLLFFSLFLGGTVSGGLIWLLWRRRARIPGRAPTVSARITEAAASNGLPTTTQMTTWTREKLRAVTAALAESEGYVVDAQPPGADKDLLLKQPGEIQPRVVVCCADGTIGPVATKRVRELFGTLAAEGIPTGWFVSPAGFATEAQVFAEQNGLVLIDGEQLLAQLRELPPMLLPKVLARAA